MFDFLMIQRARRSTLKISADLTSTVKVLTPDRGTGPGTFTGEGQWVTDHEGISRYVDSGAPAIPGSRVVRNLLLQSETFGAAAWIKQTGVTVNGSRVVYDGTGTVGAQRVLNNSFGVSGVGVKYAGSITANTNDGTTKTLYAYVGLPGTAITFIVTPTPTRFTIPLFTGDGTDWAVMYIHSGPGVNDPFDVTLKCQLENVTDQSIQLPGEYIATTSSPVAQCFDTLLNGTPIAGIKGVLMAATTVLSYPVVNLRANNMSGTIDWTPSATDPLVLWLWGAYKDASNYFGVFRDGTAGTLVFRKRIGGVNYDASYTIAVTPGITYKVGWRMGAAGVDLFVNGVKGTGNANATDAAIPTAWQIGADGNSANQGASRIKNLRLWRGKASDEKMIQVTQ